MQNQRKKISTSTSTSSCIDSPSLRLVTMSSNTNPLLVQNRARLAAHRQAQRASNKAHIQRMWFAHHANQITSFAARYPNIQPALIFQNHGGIIGTHNPALQQLNLQKLCTLGNRRLGIEPPSRHQARRAPVGDPATAAINSILEEPNESDVEMEDIYASPTPSVPQRTHCRARKRDSPPLTETG
jgi:hypothetical protein